MSLTDAKVARCAKVNLSSDPMVLQRFMEYLGRYAVRDEAVKKILLLAGLSTYSRDPLNLFLKGPSSIGKSFNVANALKFLGGDVWWLGGLSPTALVHEYGVLIDPESGEEVPDDWKDTRLEELLKENRLDKDELDAKEKRLAAKLKRQAQGEYREIAKRSYYMVELRHKILVFLEAPHPLTYQMLKPILSHDQINLTFKFTDKVGRGTLRTKTVVLSGWPATVFCTSDPKYVEDLATRGFTITPEMSEEKYRAANVLYGTRKAFLPEPDKELPIFAEYIGHLEAFLTLQNIVVLVPYGPELGEAYPHALARDMRDLPHFLALIEMFAAFHAFQRPVLEIDGEKKAILATMQDFLEAYGLLREFGETTRSGLPAHILRVFHEVMLPLSREQPEGFRYEELVRRHNETFPENVVSTKTMYRWTAELSAIGYVDTQPDPAAPRFKLIKVLKNPQDVLSHLLGTLAGSFSLESLKKWWNTLRQRYSSETKIALKIFDSDASLDELYEKFYCKIGAERNNVIENEKSLNQPPSIEKGTQTFSEDERERPRASFQTLDYLRQNFHAGTQQAFEKVVIESGLSKEEAEKLFLRLVDQGELAMDPEGWWRWTK